MRIYRRWTEVPMVVLVIERITAGALMGVEGGGAFRCVSVRPSSHFTSSVCVPSQPSR